MNTNLINTESNLMFDSREAYLVWRAQMRAEYAQLSIHIRKSKRIIAHQQEVGMNALVENDRENSSIEIENEMRERVALRIAAAEQSKLAGLRKQAAQMMALRIEGKALARAASLAKHIARQQEA